MLGTMIQMAVREKMVSLLLFFLAKNMGYESKIFYVTKSTYPLVQTVVLKASVWLYMPKEDVDLDAVMGSEDLLLERIKSRYSGLQRV